MVSKFQELLREQRLNPETSRSGLKWDQSEDDTLLEKITSGVSKEEIAKLLQRTEGSIKTRLITYAISKMETEKCTMDDVLSMYDVTEKDISDYQTKKAMREERRPLKTFNTVKKQLNNEDIASILQTINKKLDLLKKKA